MSGFDAVERLNRDIAAARAQYRQARAGRTPRPAPKTTLQAHLKQIGERRYRAICGMPHCPGDLGIVLAPVASGVRELTLRAAGANDPDEPAPSSNEWMVYARRDGPLTIGYHRRPDGRYSVIKSHTNGKPIGRTRAPLHLSTPDSQDRGGRELVGHFPKLPCVIICPVCQRGNIAALPNTMAAGTVQAN